MIDIGLVVILISLTGIAGSLSGFFWGRNLARAPMQINQQGKLSVVEDGGLSVVEDEPDPTIEEELAGMRFLFQRFPGELTELRRYLEARGIPWEHAFKALSLDPSLAKINPHAKAASYRPLEASRTAASAATSRPS